MAGGISRTCGIQGGSCSLAEARVWVPPGQALAKQLETGVVQETRWPSLQREAPQSIWEEQQNTADPKAHERPSSNVWAEGQELNTQEQVRKHSSMWEKVIRAHRLLWTDLEGSAEAPLLAR